MKFPFKLNEFIITRPKVIALEIADKLYQYHLIPMAKVRELLGVWITASNFSGYRPKWWEFRKKRSGDSQHVFKGKGAIDWTCKDFKKNRNRLLELMIEHTEYTRFAVYDTFIHADYKETGGTRQLFEYAFIFDQTKGKKIWKWDFIKNVA